MISPRQGAISKSDSSRMVEETDTEHGEAKMYCGAWGRCLPDLPPCWGRTWSWLGGGKTDLFHVGSMRGFRGSNEDHQVDALGGQILSSNEEELSGPFNALEPQLTESSQPAPGTGMH